MTRFELLYESRDKNLLVEVAKDIESASPETEVRPHEIQLRDPWDFEEVYATLHQFSRDYVFDTDQEDYLVHITTGTHVAQICLFLLTESRHFPARRCAAARAAERRRAATTPPLTAPCSKTHHST